MEGIPSESPPPLSLLTPSGHLFPEANVVGLLLPGQGIGQVKGGGPVVKLEDRSPPPGRDPKIVASGPDKVILGSVGIEIP